MILEQSVLTANPQLRYVVYAIIALLLTIINVVVIQLIAVAGVTPNLLLIMCVTIALIEGQFTGLLFGWCVGMVFDIASTDDIGLNALAMTVSSFIAGYFYLEGKTAKSLGTTRYLLVVALASLIYFTIYFLLFIRPVNSTVYDFLIKNIAASTLYTSVFSILPMLWFSRNMDRSS